MDFEERYSEYNGISTDTLVHIPEISCYNQNYYIGLKRDGCATHDLIYAESDDDNLTEYYHVYGSSSTYIGYEYTDEGIFYLTNERFT